MSATLLALVLVIHLEVGQCQEHLTSDANGGLRLGLNLFGPNRPFSLSNIFNRPSRNSRPTSDPHFAVKILEILISIFLNKEVSSKSNGYLIKKKKKIKSGASLHLLKHNKQFKSRI